VLQEFLKRAVRLAESRVIRRQRRVRFRDRELRLLRSRFWDDTEQKVFEAEILPYFDAIGEGAAPPEVIVDAGASAGHFALAAAVRWPRARIVCFEPSARQRVMLDRNARLNGVAARIQVEPLALWNSPGFLRFRTHGAMSSLEVVSSLPRHLAFEERVPAEPLDAWVARSGLPRLDWIKMDIEGAEIEALAGARATLRRFHPGLLVQAYHLRDGVRTLERCRTWLEAEGYRCDEAGAASGLLVARPRTTEPSDR
jgi:FkbM family methyltransferase